MGIFLMGILPLWQPSNFTCTLFSPLGKLAGRAIYCLLFYTLCWKIKYDDDDDDDDVCLCV